MKCKRGSAGCCARCDAMGNWRRELRLEPGVRHVNARQHGRSRANRSRLAPAADCISEFEDGTGPSWADIACSRNWAKVARGSSTGPSIRPIARWSPSRSCGARSAAENPIVTLRRFRKEARLMAEANNPHVVNLLEYNEDEGLPYLVLEFVAGASLGELLDEKNADCRGARSTRVHHGRRGPRPGRKRTAPRNRPSRHQARQHPATRPAESLQSFACRHDRPATDVGRWQDRSITG